MKKLQMFILLLLILSSNAFSQKVWYTLTDDDVVVKSGIIHIYSKKTDSINVIIPSVLDGQTVVGIAEGIRNAPGFVCTGVFYNKKITGLQLPSTLKTIGGSAFFQNSIDTLIVPEGVESISEWAFASNGIKELLLPTSLKKLGNDSFSLNKLKFFSLPAGVDSIPDYCFDSNLFTNIVIPKNIKYIGNSVFRWCKGIRTLNFEQGSQIKFIGNQSFMELALETVNLPEGLEHIGQWAFMRNNISAVTIPRSLTYIGQDCFNENKIKELFVPNTRVTFQTNGGFTVNKIEKLTFEEGIYETGSYGFNAITEVKLPEGLKIITPGAFFINPIAKLEIPFSVDSIGDNAFSATNLSLFDWPRAVSYLPSGVLSDVPLISFTLPSTVKYIGSSAFKECTALTSFHFELNSQCDSIASDAFKNCTALSDIVLPPSLNQLGEKAFFGCTSLKNVIIGSGLQTISRNTFSNCALEKVTLGENVDSIAIEAFYNNSIKSLVIPSSVRYLSGFYSNKIESLLFEEGVVELYWAFGRNSLTTVSLPQSLKYLGAGAFIENKLKVINLASVEYIGDMALMSNMLDTLVLPNTLKYLGSKALSDNFFTGVQLPGEGSVVWESNSGNQFHGGDVITNYIDSYFRVDQVHLLTLEIVDTLGRPFTDGVVINRGIRKKFPISANGFAVVEVINGVNNELLVLANEAEYLATVKLPKCSVDLTYKKVVFTRKSGGWFTLNVNVTDGQNPIADAKVSPDHWWQKDSAIGVFYQYNKSVTYLDLPRVEAQGYNTYLIKAADYVLKFPVTTVNVVLTKNNSYNYDVQFVAARGGVLMGNLYQSIKQTGFLTPIVVVPDVGYRFYAWKGENGEIISTNANHIFELNEIDQVITANFVSVKSATSLLENPLQPLISISPNPVVDKCCIACENMTRVQVFKTDGSLIKDVRIDASETTIDFQNEASGIFLIKVYNNNGGVRSGKILKQ